MLTTHPGPYLVMVSSTFTVSSLRVASTARLQLDIEFRRLAILDTIQSRALSASNVLLVYLVFGDWTLVIGFELSQLVGRVLTWRAQP
ncbi:MAG: oligosaccharide flippase family protein [Gemmatimonadetes bacterium]|nr:oligosaccharide flippase family protein [Gemmatimonadota bacterium]